MLTMLRILLSSDGPPPGASVLDLYYESLKKCESEKALSRKNTLADIVADVMTMGQPPPNVTPSLLLQPLPCAIALTRHSAVHMKQLRVSDIC